MKKIITETMVSEVPGIKDKSVQMGTFDKEQYKKLKTMGFEYDGGFSLSKKVKNFEIEIYEFLDGDMYNGKQCDYSICIYKNKKPFKAKMYEKFEDLESALKKILKQKKKNKEKE